MMEGFEQEHSFWFNESLEEEMSLSTPPLLYFHQNQVTFMFSHQPYRPYRPYHDHDYRHLPMHVVDKGDPCLLPINGHAHLLHHRVFC